MILVITLLILKLVNVLQKRLKKVELLPKELIETKNAKTIEEVSHFLNEDKSKFVKHLSIKLMVTLMLA